MYLIAEHILTPKRGILNNYLLVIENGTIKQIRRRKSVEEKREAKEVQILIPGLVNSHTHLPMSLFRGTVEDFPLSEWLPKVWDIEKRLSRKDCYYGALLSLVECTRNGITTVCDMYFHEEEVAKAVQESGLRGFLSYGMIDLGMEDLREKELEETMKFLDYISGEKFDRIKATLGPHSPYTCSKELLLEVKRISKEKNLKIQMHISETEEEVMEVKEREGLRPVEYLEKIGFLSGEEILSHGVYLSEREISILSMRGSSVVHNPISNLKLSSGVAPISEMVERGVNLLLGTDSAVSNNSLDMFQEMKVSSLVMRSMEKAVPPERYFQMATSNAGKALGIKIGEVEVGYRADLVFLEKGPNLVPFEGYISLVYSANPSNIVGVMVDGEILFQEGEYLRIDAERILRKAERRYHDGIRSEEDKMG